MQSMNTDPPAFYPNAPGAHPTTTGIFFSNGLEHFSMPNSNGYSQAQHMPSPFYNQQVQNVYGQQPIYVNHYLPTTPYHPNGARGQNAQYVPLIRPSNENSTGAPTFIPTTGYTPYGNSNMQPTSHIYSQQPFYRYSVPPQYASQTFSQQTTASQISNQVQPQYSTANTQQQTQSSQTHQPQTSQHSSSDPPHGLSSQPSQSTEKRQRKPLLIVDPVSQKAVEVKASNPTNNSPSTSIAQDDNRLNDPTTTNTKAADEPEKTQKRDDFRKQFALLLDQHPSAEKNANPSSTDDQNDGNSTEEKQTEDVISRTQDSTLNQLSEPAQPGHPGIPIRSINDEKPKVQDNTKQERNDSQKPRETSESMSEDTTDNVVIVNSDEKISSDDSTTKDQSQPIPSLSNIEPVECATLPSPSVETPVSSNNTESELVNAVRSLALVSRHSYTKQELLSKRLYPSAQKRPLGLRAIDGVTDPPTARLITHSITRGTHIPLDKPELQNRSEKPYIPAVRNKIESNEKFLRDITAILNKVTPQTYEKLLKQLDELELDRYERLDGMITIIFAKAVDERSFCFLYAKLCQYFQKKQITVPDETGNKVTHSFRQLLLTRCQKEFENDYRQEIGYEKKKIDVDAITDEKLQKEESEKLEENLSKAKRKKLGNIFFIGELFKLQMLTDLIMYDCIDYLLRDKTDEESLECLCKLLNTIGKELDLKTSDKAAANRKILEKNYTDLFNITTHRQTSARLRFMIQDVMDLRKANWVARRAEAKPTTIDEIHEQERLKREQQERDQERDKALRRESNRGGNNSYGHNSQQYTGGRGSGMKQQSNRTDDEQSGNRFNVNSVRQLQKIDRRNEGPLALNLAPQGAWSKGSAVEKKPENDRPNLARNSKPPAVPASQSRSKTGYNLQSQSSRELIRENSTESSRKTSTSGVASPNNISMANSREGSRNVSREQSREKPSSERASYANATVSSNKVSTLVNNTDSSKTSFDEEKTIAHVHSLIEEYTENYSDNDERPIQEALDDVMEFCTTNVDQQALIVRELFTNVLEAKPRARKAIGHLLDVVLHKNIISNDGFLSGFKMLTDLVPDYAVDIPLIWQYIGEILGAFIGGPSPNMSLLKPILQMVPAEKAQPLFKYIIKFAIEISSKSRIQKFWQSSGFSLNDLFKSDSIDSIFTNEFNWLSEIIPATAPLKENRVPLADAQLVKLFKSVNDQNTVITDGEIIEYIETHMNSEDKFYIRNIVLSYLEACLINREPQKKIQEDIAKNRMTVLKTIIEHRSEAEIQAVYAIQNFVNKLEHPPKMAQLLFDIFYDEECVSEDAFFEWLRNPDQSETEGHSVVEISTKDFFTWLEQAETELEEGEEES
ncbi:unnamed protein product [Rotaria socialis]